MQTFLENNKLYTKIDNLRQWTHNPRKITQPALDRLVTQIQQLGQYKPLLIMNDGVVLGGNMRLLAMQKLNIENVWVSIVEFKKNTIGSKWRAVIDGVEQQKQFSSLEQAMMEYSLSDNDRAGFYDNDAFEQALVDLNLDISQLDYSIDFKEPISLNISDDNEQMNQNEELFEKKYQVVVEVSNEQEQEEIYNKLLNLGLKCKTLTL